MSITDVVTFWYRRDSDEAKLSILCWFHCMAIKLNMSVLPVNINWYNIVNMIKIENILLITEYGPASPLVFSCWKMKMLVMLVIIIYVSVVILHLTSFWHVLGSHPNPGEESISHLHFLSECKARALQMTSTQVHLGKNKIKKDVDIKLQFKH